MKITINLKNKKVKLSSNIFLEPFEVKNLITKIDK